ncbi:proton-conducting transporter membrane subunit [Salinisphaera sp.]|uniref:proton-conducting transporter transmembrane domain-containing protein n=1 Tax=Salinisphaera sp. TaxID=1914330 RepID=UPI000C44E249|nr:proton-conducting transporter membrane subunit [Salinisphaera sp.]MAS08477.1 cation:proton antiporter [Salinisphaera sp.]|tara:strand:- start:772 stop:2238 length:1467 start_codon:yes stop_codon:yes gene_type:complete
MSDVWLAWLVAWPVVMALPVALFGRWPNLREAISLATGVALLVGVATFIGPVAAGARPSFSVFSILPGLDLAFALEPFGLIFALIAAALWPLTTLYAAGYMRGNDEPHQTRFFVCFALAISAAIGMAFSANLLTLFVFYEMMTLTTYPLVTHHQDVESRDSGRVYIGILMVTSIGLFLPAIVITWLIAGNVDFTPGGVFADTGLGGLAAMGLYGAFIYGVGKAAVMPIHRWLPAAMVAPTPVSALLHAVAVVKAGAFTVLKITVYIFGIDFLQVTGASEPFVWLASFTLLAASIVAIYCDNLKKRLAYSTIGQLSYIVLGAAMASRLGAAAGGLHIVAHAFGKITLFFCAGAIYTAVHRKYVSQLNGLGRAMPLTFAAFTVAALSLIGLPPLAGAWSKWYLMSGALDVDMQIVLGVLAVSSLLNIVYLLDIPARAFFLPADDQAPRGFSEAPAACVIPLMITATGCVVLFFYARPILDFIAGSFGSTA